MLLKNQTLALLLFTSAIIFLSFSKKEKEDPFFYKNIEKEMCLIPGEEMYVDSLLPSFRICIGQQPKKIKIDSFYLSNHEVTNLEYRRFVLSILKEDYETYKRLLPDTACWNKNYDFLDQYIEWYFRHPAYNEYPVVGITQEQAEAYCAWLTKKYMSIEKRKYKNLVFKLPTLNQWTYAAKGGIEAVLPFKNLKLADSRGVLQAHFRNINQEDIQIEKDMVKINSDITSPYYQQGCWITIVNDPTYPSISLTPSHFKLYNLAGNVKEYIAEKGITKGGGWKDTGYFLQNFVCQTYDSTNTTSEDRGFRVAMEIIK